MNHTDLEQWNLKQRKLWLEIVYQGLVDRQDYKMFKQFAIIFCWYYEKNNFEPSLKEMILLLGLIP